MKNILTILTGVGMLIAVYLVLSRSKETVAIIDSISRNATAGIKVLQARA